MPRRIIDELSDKQKGMLSSYPENGDRHWRVGASLPVISTEPIGIQCDGKVKALCS